MLLSDQVCLAQLFLSERSTGKSALLCFLENVRKDLAMHPGCILATAAPG